MEEVLCSVGDLGCTSAFPPSFFVWPGELFYFRKAVCFPPTAPQSGGVSSKAYDHVFQRNLMLNDYFLPIQ